MALTAKIKGFYTACRKTVKRLFDHVSTWVLSLFATLLIPSIPLAIEYFKTDSVANGTLEVTNAILSSTMLFTAQHNFFRVFYLGILTLSLLSFALTPAKGLPSDVGSYAGLTLLAVCCLHSIERFKWHVIDDRPFPDTKVEVKIV